jgi:hypothetical protein
MTDIDWLDCECSCLFGDEEEEEEYPIAICGYWSCPGDCEVCVAVAKAMKRMFLPIYGPVNKDGEPMGFLLVTSEQQN